MNRKDYLNYNDYELINMALENNEDAISFLYKKYDPLINKKAKKIYNILKKSGIEFDDVKQECLLAFERAITSFNPNNKTLFYTFVNVCIDRQLKGILLKNNRDKYRVLNEAVSLDAVNKEGEEVNILDTYIEQTSNPEYNMLLEEDKNELERLIKNQLTASEELVFDLKMQGFSYQEIEAITGKDNKTIYNTAQRVKSKIIKILEER